MALKSNRGRRVAPSAGGKSATPKVVLGGSAAKVAKTLPDGEHELVLTGARSVVGKSGSASVVLSADTVDGTPVKLETLLVHSPGGDSDLVWAGRAVLETLLGLGEGESIDLDEALPNLKGITFEVELEESTNHRGEPVNKLVQILSVNGADIEE
jgi:hypothetical protein